MDKIDKLKWQIRMEACWISSWSACIVFATSDSLLVDTVAVLSNISFIALAFSAWQNLGKDYFKD